MESKKDSSEKRIEKLRELLPLFWSSYQHMYDKREGRADQIINFLLMISTFLAVLCATLYTTKLFSNIIILLPIIPQTISIFILLKHTSIGNPALHWFKIDNNFLNSLYNGNFEINTLSTLKRLEDYTHESMKENQQIINSSRNLVFYSLAMIVLAVNFILFNGSLWLYLLCSIFGYTFYKIFFVYYKKGLNLIQAEEDSKQRVILLQKWVSEGNEIKK